jgi:esterase/lipase
VAGFLNLPNLYIDKQGSNLADPAGRLAHLSLDAQPLVSALSLEYAGARLREELFRIHRPTLILHGARDGVCPVQNAWKVAERLGTWDTRVVIFPRSQHIITRDFEKSQVREELRSFFQRMSAGDARSPRI